MTSNYAVNEMKARLSINICTVFALAFGAAPIARAEVFSTSIVSAEATMAVQHGSSLIELDDGSLLVSWYAGGKEGARDSRILVRHSAAGGASWEPTQIAVNPRECAAESWFTNKTLGNTVLFQDKENIVWLFYAAVEFGGWSGAHVDYKISRDRGRTWSESHRLTNGLGDIPRSKPVELGPHEIFLPLSHSALRKYPSGARLEIANGKIVRKMSSPIAGSKGSHPAFVAFDPNCILAFLRARGGGSLQGTFFDPGRNGWSIPEPTNLPNPDSAIDAVRLNDGRILLAYNDDGTIRNPLSIAVSDDPDKGGAEASPSVGSAFRKLRDIDNEAGQDFSYPSLVRARDGTFYLTYTWHYRSAIKWVHFDANWLGLNPVIVADENGAGRQNSNRKLSVGRGDWLVGE
jgi:predicted neuraminidase